MRTMHRQTASRAAGFTLVELLITVLLVAEILIIAGLLFDLHNKTARVQTNVSEMQQSIRVAQREMVDQTRMAGRGGLPAHLAPGSPGVIPSLDNGLAVEVDNDVSNTFEIVTGQAKTKAVPGTDVLRVRGVFDTPIYQLLSTGNATDNLILLPTPDDPASATDGTVVIRSPSPSGFLQDLSYLVPDPSNTRALQDRALVLVSPLSDAIYAVVSIDSVTVNTSDLNGDPTQVSVAFKTVDGTHAAAFSNLFPSTGNLPNNLTGVAFAGLLEEQVFYVREHRAIPGDAGSELQPKLTRERVHPGTSVAIDPDVDRELEDLADNILDLQVALGFNSTLGSLGYFDRDNLDNLVIEETADGTGDDWLFNAAADDETAVPWVGPWDAATPQPELYFVRISTLARTDGRDFKYVSRPILGIEDRVYSEPYEPSTHDPDRMFRRRLLQTMVDLRNL